MSTLEKYTQANFKTAPTGYLMPNYSDDSELKKLFETIADGLLDAQIEADQQLDEVFPDNAGAYLADWERILGLPLEGLENLTTQQRLGMVKNWLNIDPLSNAEFFVKIAEAAGYTITITTFEPFRAGSGRAGESLSFGDYSYLYFQVNAPASTAITFKTGSSRAGEPLVDYGNDALETLIKFFAPAHAIVLFDYT